MTYLVMMNSAGCLPDNEPIECTTLVEAKQASRLMVLADMFDKWKIVDPLHIWSAAYLKSGGTYIYATEKVGLYNINVSWSDE